MSCSEDAIPDTGETRALAQAIETYTGSITDKPDDAPFHPLRIEVVKEGLLNNISWADIASACHCSYITVWRDWKGYMETEDGRAWLFEQYFRVFGKKTITDAQRLNSLTRLIGKSMTSRKELKRVSEDKQLTIITWEKPTEELRQILAAHRADPVSSE